jgi:hypothetical protein
VEQYNNESARRYRMILVDDEDEVRGRISSRISAESGFDVVGTAGNGYDALDLVEEYDPHVVLTDIKMPYIDGIELDAIAACVVGGISFSGGIGKVSGAIAGVLMFTIISYGMTFVGLDQYYQYIMKGVIIVFAVAVDTQKYLKKT